MNPFEKASFKNNKWHADYEHRTLKSPERNYGTGTTHYLTLHNSERAAVVALMNYCFANGIEYDEKLVYRDFVITVAESYTRQGFQFTHVDYDGPEDNRTGFANNVSVAKQLIDSYIEENQIDEIEAPIFI